MVNIVIIAIHGIGMADSDYYNNFEKNLHKSLTKAGIPKDKYVFGGIHYSEVFRDEADKISHMTEDLNWKSLRRFVTHSLGDALAYQAGVSTENRIDFYELVHTKIDEELNQIIKSHNVPEDTPILFVAHSLGAYVISNYIWDKQKEFPDGRTLLDMGTLCGLITMGCNIPILTLGFDYDKLYPITIPGNALINYSEKQEFNWTNVYDKNDPLSMPLQQLYSYRTEEQKITIEQISDIEMNVGNLFIRYTPYSHTKYWNHGEFIDLIKDKIISLFEVLD